MTRTNTKKGGRVTIESMAKTPSGRRAIGDAVAIPPARPVMHAIDQLLSTLYANDISGYGLVSHDVLRSEAVKRANEKMASLDAAVRKPLKEGFEYRIAEFDKFHNLPKSEREKVIELAKRQAIPLEEAYALRAAK